MPPYLCHDNDILMGGTDMDHSPRSEPYPIHRPSFAVLRTADLTAAFVAIDLDLDLDDPCAADELSSAMPSDSSASVSSTASSHSHGSSHTSSHAAAQKHVSFTALHIRQHSVILGDHPCCTMGLPVTLDWAVESEVSVDLEQYEATRRQRRSRTELRLSLDERRALLADISDSDVRRVQRKLHKDRRCTGRAKELFFSCGDEPVGTLGAVGTVGSAE